MLVQKASKLRPYSSSRGSNLVQSSVLHVILSLSPLPFSVSLYYHHGIKQRGLEIIKKSWMKKLTRINLTDLNPLVQVSTSNLTEYCRISGVLDPLHSERLCCTRTLYHFDFSKWYHQMLELTWFGGEIAVDPLWPPSSHQVHCTQHTIDGSFIIFCISRMAALVYWTTSWFSVGWFVGIWWNTF